MTPHEPLNGSSRLTGSGPGQELVMNERSRHDFRRISTVPQQFPLRHSQNETLLLGSRFPLQLVELAGNNTGENIWTNVCMYARRSRRQTSRTNRTLKFSQLKRLSCLGPTEGKKSRLYLQSEHEQLGRLIQEKGDEKVPVVSKP